MRFELETSVGQGAVFDEVADFEVIERWDPFVRRSTLLSGDAMAEGATYALESPGGFTLEYRMIDVDRPRFAVYQGGTERVRSTDTVAVEETSRGSRVSVTSDLRFIGWAKLIAPFVMLFIWVGGRFVSLPAMRRHLERTSAR